MWCDAVRLVPPPLLTCMHVGAVSQEQLSRQRKQLKVETGSLSAEEGAAGQQEFKSSPMFKKYFQVGGWHAVDLGSKCSYAYYAARHNMTSALPGQHQARSMRLTSLAAR